MDWLLNIIFLALGIYVGYMLLQAAALRGRYVNNQIILTALAVIGIVALLLIGNAPTLLVALIWLIIGAAIGSIIRGYIVPRRR